MGNIRRPGVTLEDRWEATGQVTLLTGIQAVVRVPLLRKQLDVAQGWNTAGYISGYRGSPLGTFDKELGNQAKRLAEANIVFNPGLNEDLAATAVWGSQQTGLYPDAKFDGVFGIWYGKGPGVDRSGDVLRHANSAGTSPRGGVLALAGDDPSAKSSTVTNGSEYAFVDVEIPMLDPSGVADVLEYGVKAFDLSRYAGLWVGMKCVAETMDGAATVNVDPAAYATLPPTDFIIPPEGVHIRPGDTPIAQEARLRGIKLPAAIAFARANGFNKVMLDSPVARFGIAARGKAYATLRQALSDAGITEEMARMLGLRLWKVGMAWPLDPVGAREFARGLEEVLVVEDRRALLEPQLRDALYHEAERPRITGKRDAEGRPLLSELTELDTAQVLRALAARLPEPFRTDRLRARLAELDALAAPPAPLHERTPYFCPGCPHNTSTRVPEGSQALAGIGCHFLARYMDRSTEQYTQMGGEGAPWLGQMHFVQDPHVFANMGDGTYAHSGSLAIRAAVAAKATMTFKILVNSAVAMTGGQTPEGEITVPHVAAQAAAEGVRRIVVVSDDPERHQDSPMMPKGVAYHHRSELDAVQRELREASGVSVLIYDQECATERRRKRKRGRAPQATRRALINARVCEDCGDCSRTSNCLAVEPVETPFGRKRRIDQSACNQDLSCVEGFCPSFVTLVGAEPARPPAKALPAAAELPDPVLPEPREGEAAWNILLAGVGGQGVTALAAILGMAAHLEGRPVRSVDMLGLAQKGGGVYAQLRIGRVGAAPDDIAAPRIDLGAADLLVAADMVVAHGRTARPLLGPHRTVAVLNADLAPTAQFVLDTGTRYDRGGMLDAVRAACREVVALPAAAQVADALGDLIYLNVYLLGIAFQRGLVPLSAEAIERALELNGTQVERNKAAFAAGRAAALAEPAPVTPEAEPLDALIARRVADLTAYQNADYAKGYLAFVNRVRLAEKTGVASEERLTRAVATQLYRLMAYKDEYEVARLHSLPEWREQIERGFTGTQRVEMHMAPPALAARDPGTGVARKRTFVSAGASFMPSPIIATLAFSCCTCLTTSTLPEGRTPANTFSMPTILAISSAVRLLSPVSMTGSIPRDLSAAMASFAPRFGASSSPIAPTTLSSTEISTAVLPSLCNFSTAGSETAPTKSGLPTFIVMPPYFAVTPLPGVDEKSSASFGSTPLFCAWLTIAFASGCSDQRSAIATNSKTCMSCLTPDGKVATFCSCITSVTLGLPSVRVPVLSNIATETLLSVSMASPPLNMTPFDAPLPMPTIMAVGVASPRAQGHATTRIATAGIIAESGAPGDATKYHARNVAIATAITAYAKYPATLSTIFCIAGFLPIASSTSLTTCDRNESAPTLAALTSSMPSLLTVPPITPSPAFLCTGADSPVAIDSSTADSPWTTVESTGTRSPGLTTMRSPGWISSIGLSISEPSFFFTLAVFGWSSSILRIIELVLPFVLISRYLPSMMNVTTSAEAS
jgi:indolepyruvate ferredoxin oxidoreductase